MDLKKADENDNFYFSSYNNYQNKFFFIYYNPSVIRLKIILEPAASK